LKKKATGAQELDHNFGLIGYLNIFHTDNGKEFNAKTIIQLLKELHPAIITVYRGPCITHNQGSVESMNKLVKHVLTMIESQVRTSGIKPN
jgi:hypothetical protein